jgi:hypothetical protein
MYRVKTYGRLGKYAKSRLSDMAERAADSGDCDRDCSLHGMREETSFGLIRDIAGVYCRRSGSPDQGHWD